MRENPYPGIDAHLNSLLQTPGTPDQPSIWPGFHSQHITHIVDALNAQLPSHYLAIGEQSLQIRTTVDDYGVEAEYPKPDIAVYQPVDDVPGLSAPVAIQPTWAATLADVMELVKQPRAVIIREIQQGKLGSIVARIELLSPTNKRRGGLYNSYMVKRAEALDTGIPLVEIDYLHESPPLVRKLPRYPIQPEAHPYHVIVSDPRPNWNEGQVLAYGFRVGDPIKSFPLPLAGKETLIFNLNEVYQHSFQAGRWAMLIDYTQEPERFQTYSPDDQRRIGAVMAKLKP